MAKGLRKDRGSPSRLVFSLAVPASFPKGFEHGFAAVFADENFSDELVVRAISRFVNRWCATRSAEQLRLETGIHEPIIIARENKQERERNLMTRR